jgi:hypothetical protein
MLKYYLKYKSNQIFKKRILNKNNIVSKMILNHIKINHTGREGVPETFSGVNYWKTISQINEKCEKLPYVAKTAKNGRHRLLYF